LIISFRKLIFLLLSAKLGVFPFFYWIVVVRVKVSFFANIFVLRLQKYSVFWLLWLVYDVSLTYLYLYVYLGVFFVVFRLLIIRDLWLLLIYSSVSNTAMILLRLYGSNYFFVYVLYLTIILLIIFMVWKINSFIEGLLIVFFFLVIPPFVLFFMKFYIILSLDSILKLGFFLFIFDVIVVLDYFSLVFMKFLLIDLGVLIYIINFLVLLMVLTIRNCVAMNIFN
jgi:hypothetical protein